MSFVAARCHTSVVPFIYFPGFTATQHDSGPVICCFSYYLVCSVCPPPPQMRSGSSVAERVHHVYNQNVHLHLRLLLRIFVVSCTCTCKLTLAFICMPALVLRTCVYAYGYSCGSTLWVFMEFVGRGYTHLPFMFTFTFIDPFLYI